MGFECVVVVVVGAGGGEKPRDAARTPTPTHAGRLPGACTPSLQRRRAQCGHDETAGRGARREAAEAAADDGGRADGVLAAAAGHRCAALSDVTATAERAARHCCNPAQMLTRTP
ncbi:unnamed protein product [Gadus morhua 'NCC']